MNHARKIGNGGGIIFLDEDPDFICLFRVMKCFSNFCNDCFNKRIPGKRVVMGEEFDSVDMALALLDLFSLLYDDMKGLLDSDELDGTNACAGNILNLVVLVIGCVYCGKKIDKVNYGKVVEYSAILKGMEKKKWWDWNYAPNSGIYWEYVL
jgi:hypothetical protein